MITDHINLKAGNPYFTGVSGLSMPLDHTCDHIMNMILMRFAVFMPVLD